MARKHLPKTSISVIGMDPSMSNWGLAAVELDLESLAITAKDIQLIETQPSNSKKIRKNIQDIGRFRTLYNGFTDFFNEHKPELLFVEMPHGSQNANAMKSYGCCVALLCTIDIPMITLTATDLKKCASKKKAVTKAEMIDHAVANYPDLDWLLNNSKGTLLSKNEHMADALIAIEAGIKDDEFKNLQALSRNFGRN